MSILTNTVIELALQEQFSNAHVIFREEIYPEKLMFEITVITDVTKFSFIAPYGCSFGGIRRNGNEYRMILFVQTIHFLEHYKLDGQ